MMTKDHTYWMRKAITISKDKKTPYAAIIVNETDDYIAAFNTTKQDGPTAHAEINAIQKLKQLNVNDAKKLRLYSTVEPCPMCMSAIVWAGIGEVVFGAIIEDASEFGQQITISSQDVANQSWYPIKIKGRIEREECKRLFKNK
jgi:tRNA(Arg) A34 adenosine deaminase TadA